MSLHKDYDDSQSFSDFNIEEDMDEVENIEDLDHHKKHVRRMLEERLERKRLKEELEDELERDFDWDDVED